MPKEKDRRKIRPLLLLIVIGAVNSVVMVASIVVLCVVPGDRDCGFWVSLAVFIGIAIFCAFLFVYALFDRVGISADTIEFGSLWGKYYCDMKNIDFIEPLRRYRFRGVALHFIEPLPLYRRGKLVKGKTISKYVFVESPKIVRILKKFVPNEIEWIHTNYDKYPDTGHE